MNAKRFVNIEVERTVNAERRTHGERMLNLRRTGSERTVNEHKNAKI